MLVLYKERQGVPVFVLRQLNKQTETEGESDESFNQRKDQARKLGYFLHLVCICGCLGRAECALR